MLQQLNRLMGSSEIILYGANGHGKVIVDILETNGITIKRILDDNENIKEIVNYQVIQPDYFEIVPTDRLIISIGNNKVRKILSSKIKATFAKVIHPKAIISKHSIIDEGTVVMAGAVINTSVSIGKHCIVNTAASIDHDCFINDFVHISPNVSLAGNVTVGEGSQVGIGAIVIQGITIGKWVTIGAGAVIINDVPDFAVVVGNPGRIIKYNYNND